MKNIKGKISRFLTRWENMRMRGNRKSLFLGLQILRLKWTRGFYFVEIHDNELDARGKEFEESFLNWREQKKYLDVLNPRKYYILARNKYITHQMLDALGIKEKSTLYCYYDSEMGESSEVCACTSEDVCKILKSKGVTKFVVKTTESSHGDNVKVVRKIKYNEDLSDAELELYNGDSIKLKKILGTDPLIFEEKIDQAKFISEINPSSVNTFRFMTTLFPNGEARIIACFFKMGRIGKCVDNAGSGGNVDAAVDINKGEINNAIIYRGVRDSSPIDFHPDSKVRLQGLSIPNWDEICSKVIEFQKKMPFVKAAGWDIAITENGPIVIEVNDMWDRIGQVFIGKGWKKEIKECYDAWMAYAGQSKI